MSINRRYFLHISPDQVVLTREPVTFDRCLSGQIEVEGHPLRGYVSLTSTMRSMKIGTPVDVITEKYSEASGRIRHTRFNTAGGGRRIGSIRYFEGDQK